MNIDKLKKVIQEANPEIMELKFGCYLKHKEGKSMVMGKFGNDWIDCVNERERRKVKDCKILGRPIRFADVLLAIEKKVKKSNRDSKREFELLSNYMEYLWAEIKNLLKKWDLRKDLDNQSDELKRFLDKLLVK